MTTESDSESVDGYDEINGLTEEELEEEFYRQAGKIFNAHNFVNIAIFAWLVTLPYVAFHRTSGTVTTILITTGIVAIIGHLYALRIKHPIVQY